MKFLKNRRGDGFIETTVALVIFALLIMLFVYTARLTVLHQQVDAACDLLLESATAAGQFGQAYEAALRDTQQEFPGMTAQISDGGHVQFGEKMTLTLVWTTRVQWIGNVTVPVTVQVTKSGLSERYWK